jgi:folate-binding protein YgfZ
VEYLAPQSLGTYLVTGNTGRPFFTMIDDVQKPQVYSCPLDHRGVVSVSGEDASDFLQGLISQNMTKIGLDRAAYGAFLTAQGKFLHEFCIARSKNAFLLECERDRAADLVSRLSRFKLRAKIDIADMSDRYRVFSVFSPDDPSASPSLFQLSTEPGDAKELTDGVVFVDPRVAALGCRVIMTVSNHILAVDGAEAAPFEGYDAWRIKLGVADGARDMEIEKTTLAEANLDLLNGIDWDKGCYMGQEITARSHYRGLVKRRLVPIRFTGNAAPSGTEISSDGAIVGEIRSRSGSTGLANLRLDQFKKKNLRAGDIELVVDAPEWLEEFTASGKSGDSSTS